MQKSNLCFAANCAKNALNEAVCATVSSAALNQWANIIELIKCYTGLDINTLFEIIAILTVLCFLSRWLLEVVHFVTNTIPKVIRNVCRGKLSFCILDCDNEEPKHSSKSAKSSSFRY